MQLDPSAYFLETLALEEAEFDQLFAVDWNGDNRVDLVAYNENEGVHELIVFPQLADGRLGDPTTSILPISGARRPFLYLVDLDGNGLPEIISPKRASGPYAVSAIEIGVQDGSGNVASPFTPISPEANWGMLHFHDINGDGLLEIFAYDGPPMPAAIETGNLWILNQDSALTFTSSLQREGVEPTPGFREAFADVDDDGFIDYVSFDAASGVGIDATIRIYSGGPSYAFTDESVVSADQTRQLLTFGDLDGDGRIDIVLDGSYGLTLIFQNSDGTYDVEPVLDPRTPSFRQSTRIVDLDGDGDMDIVGYQSASSRVRSTIQVSARSFAGVDVYDLTATEPLHAFTENRQFLIADLNNDNRPDVAGPIISGPGVGYNRLGSYPVADVGVTIQSDYQFSTEGSTLDYQIVTTNAGPETTNETRLLVRIQSNLEIVSFDGDCEIYVASTGMDSHSSRAGTGIICSIVSLAANESSTLNLATRAYRELLPDTFFDLDAIVEMPDQIDANPLNNVSSAADDGNLGNFSFWDVPYDELFVNESTGQMLVPAIRDSTSIGGVHVRVLLKYDTAEKADFLVNFDIFGIEHSPGNVEMARAVVDIETQDGQEGTEQATAFIDPPSLTKYHVKINLRDDLTGISAVGAEPFTEVSSPYRAIEILSPVSEPIAGVVADFTGDGWMDICLMTGSRFSINGYWLEIFAGSSSGFDPTPTSQIARTTYATDIAAGDLNNDGRPDVLVANEDGLQVYVSDGLGGITEGQYIAAAANYKVALSDLDASGTLDVVSIIPAERGELPSPTLEIYMQDHTGVLNLSQAIIVTHYTEPRLIVAELNNDSRPEIVTTSSNYAGPNVNVLFQQKNGSYAAPIEKRITGPTSEFGFAYPSGLVAGDIDSDGFNEILPFDDLAIVKIEKDTVVESVGQIRTLRGFSEFDVADMNNDGRLDIVTHGSELPSIREQLADGTFLHRDSPRLSEEGPRYFRNQRPWIIADLNRDNTLDIVSIAVSRGFAGDPIHSWIGYNWSEYTDLSVAIIDSSDAISEGSSGSATLRVSNDASVTTDESTLLISTTSNIRISDVYAAAGTCGLLQANRQNSGCLLPRLAGGGYVDVLISYEAIGSGAAEVTADLQGRSSDVDESDNTVIQAFSIEASTLPPQPPPPSGGTTGGGGGAPSPLLLVLLGSWFVTRKRASEPAQGQRIAWGVRLDICSLVCSGARPEATTTR